MLRHGLQSLMKQDAYLSKQNILGLLMLFFNREKKMAPKSLFSFLDINLHLPIFTFSAQRPPFLVCIISFTSIQVSLQSLLFKENVATKIKYLSSQNLYVRHRSNLSCIKGAKNTLSNQSFAHQHITSI